MAYCLQEANYVKYEEVILQVLSILDDRFVPDVSPELALRVKEMLLRYNPKN